MAFAILLFALGLRSDDFLFQVPEEVGIEEFADADIQPLAESLQGVQRGGMIPSAQDVAHGVVLYTAYPFQGAKVQIPLRAQFQDSSPHGSFQSHFSCLQYNFPAKYAMIYCIGMRFFRR